MDIIVDIDGTLADISHRRHFVARKPKNWKAFFAAMYRDPPIRTTIAAVQALHAAGHWIIITSGRPADYKATTVRWLEDHDVPYHALYMRHYGDLRSDVIVKRELLFSIRETGCNPVLAIDDRQGVVDMWRAEGLACWQVAPGSF